MRFFITILPCCLELHPFIIIIHLITGARTKSKSEPARLVIASNRLRIVHVMHASLLPNVKLVTFKHDHCDLDGILSK